MMDYLIRCGLSIKDYGQIFAISGVVLYSQLLQSGGFPSRWRLSWNRTGLSSPMMWAVTLKHEFSVPLRCCLHPAAVG